MSVNKLCRRTNNANHEEDRIRIHFSRIQGLPLLSLLGSTSDNIRWCPSLALVYLFKTTSDPQSVAISFSFGWSPQSCSAGFPSVVGLIMVPLMAGEHCQYLHLPPEGPLVWWVGGNPGSPLGALFRFQEICWDCFPTPITRLGLSQNVWFLVN